MKVGIITFHFQHHYGAQLQAYAIRRAVETLGHECLIVDYRPRSDAKTAALFTRSAMRNLHTLLHYAPLKKRAERFEEFREDTPHTAERYRHSWEMTYTDRDLRFDCYVTGSDQIWRPFKDGAFDPVYFADFAENAKIVAYAPSLGKEELLPDTYHDELAILTADIANLSAREQTAADTLSAVTRRPVELVADPTLLLDAAEWEEIAHTTEHGDYALVYSLGTKFKIPPGRKIVQLCGTRRNVAGADSYVLDAGPREFLGLVKNAAEVYTDSFHGAAFSKIFGKPLTLHAKAKDDARFQTLLTRDLAQLKQTSLAWLENAINN